MAYMPTQELEVAPNLGLSIEDTETVSTNTDGLSLEDDTVPNKTPAIRGNVAKNRAQKAHYGLGPMSPGIAQLEHSMNSGDEDGLRTGVASLATNVDRTESQAKLAKAAKDNVSLSPQEINKIIKLTPYDPGTVMENKFGDKVAKDIFMTSLTAAQIQREAPQVAEQMAPAFAKVVARKQLLHKAKEDLDAEVGDQSYWRYGLQLGRQFMPMFSASNRSTSIEGALAPGIQMERDREMFWSFETNEEAKEFLDQRVSALKKGNWLANPLDAQDYLKKMMEYGRSDYIVDNLIGGMDTQSIAGVAASVGKIAVLGMGIKRIMRNTVKSLDDPIFSPSHIPESVGDLAKAAEIRVKDITRAADPFGMSHELVAKTPLIHDVGQIYRLGESRLSDDRVEKSLAVLEMNAAKGMKAIGESLRADRVPFSNLPALGDETTSILLREFPSVNDAFITTRIVNVPGSNTPHLQMILGNRDGTGFKSFGVANKHAQDELGLDFRRFSIVKESENEGLLDANRSAWASNYPKDRNKEFTYQVLPHGEQYFISITKPIDETSRFSRDILLPTHNKNPINAGTHLLNRWKGAENVLSPHLREGRHAVNMTPQVIFEVIEDMVKLLPRLPKSSSRQLEKVLIHNRDHINYSTGDRGFHYANQHELEKGWRTINGRYPTETESLAYWNYHQVMDLDWIVRNFGVHRDLSRQGVEMQAAKIAKINQKTGDLEDLEMNFPGKFIPEFPTNLPGNPGILFIPRGSNSGQPVFKYWKDIEKDPKLMDELKRMHSENGYKWIQVANPVDRPLANFIDKNVTVNFVLAKDTSSYPLPMNLVDYNPGVHVQYPQTNMVKQVVVEPGEKGITRYYGDKAIWGFYTQKEATKFANALDELRIMMKANWDNNKSMEATPEMLTHIEKNLPKDYDYWKKQFHPDNGYLSLNNPIRQTYSGQTIFDTHPSLKDRFGKYDDGSLINEKASEYNLFRSINMDFLANRDGPLQTVRTGGTPEKPIYSVADADVLSPNVSLQRSIGNSITSLINNDSKLASIEQYVQQYAQLYPDPTAARKNPFQTFYHTEMVDSIENRDLINSAKAAKERILGFIGTQSEYGKDILRAQQTMMNQMGEGLAKAYTHHELTFLKNPMSFIRSNMFDLQFGLFALHQLPIQSMGLANVVGLAGARSGVAGFAGYMLQRMGMHLTKEDAILRRYDLMARAFGWKEGEFLESVKLLKQTGFDKVGFAHAMDLWQFEPEMFGSGIVRNFLKAGRWPFYEGERINRISAWHAAFHEYKRNNPLDELTKQDIDKIRLRADTLALSMTRASHSKFQEGWMVPIAMYQTFSQRLFETVWTGGLTDKLARPTRMERAKMFMTNAALFGIPTMGAAATFWPWDDQLRKYMLTEPGMAEYLETWYGRLAMNGAINAILFHATGKDYNTDQRFGPGPSDIVSKTLGIGEEQSVFEFFSGPPGAMIEGALGNMYPLTMGLYNWMKTGRNNITMSDLLAVGRIAKGPNTLYNAYMAINANIYISSRGKTIAKEGITDSDGIAMAFGLTPRFISNDQLIRSYNRDRAKFVAHVTNQAVEEILRGYTFLADGNVEAFRLHQERAQDMMRVYGKFNDEQIWRAMSRAVDDGKDLIARSKDRFLREATPEQREHFLNKLLGK